MGKEQVVMPSQMYIGFQKHVEGSNNLPLGFATYFEENKAYEKRKDTIDRWAAGGYYGKQPVIQRHSEVLNNEALNGFKIAKSVRRYGWNGGNVVWRIEDPRGFELEISSANMASIIDTCTLEAGEIMRQCRWAWNKTGGSRLMLIPEGTELYQDAVITTQTHNHKVSIKDVNIGDTVVLKSGASVIYMGYMNVVSLAETQLTSRQYRHGYGFPFGYQGFTQVNSYSKDLVQKKYHVFKTVFGETGIVYGYTAKPNIALIKDRNNHTLPLSSSLEEINKNILGDNATFCTLLEMPTEDGHLYIKGSRFAIFVTISSVDLKSLEFKSQDISITKLEELIKSDKYNSFIGNCNPFFGKLEGSDEEIFCRPSYYNYAYYKHKEDNIAIRLYEVTFTPGNMVITESKVLPHTDNSFAIQCNINDLSSTFHDCNFKYVEYEGSKYPIQL